MMTDRELLEMAAKAAGYAVEWHEVVVSRKGRFGLIEHTKKEGFRLNFQRWEPLTDDGDALRLAAEVGLVVCVMRNAGFTGIYLPSFSIGGKYDEVQNHGSDHLAATRRALVRAAAEIGRSMK
jgi:hypothetical protein